MAKIRVHIGGTVVLEVPDSVAGTLEGEAFEDALNDAFLDIPDQNVLARLTNEWQTVGYAGENSLVDGRSTGVISKLKRQLRDGGDGLCECGAKLGHA